MVLRVSSCLESYYDLSTQTGRRKAHTQAAAAAAAVPTRIRDHHRPLHPHASRRGARSAIGATTTEHANNNNNSSSTHAPAARQGSAYGPEDSIAAGKQASKVNEGAVRCGACFLPSFIHSAKEDDGWMVVRAMSQSPYHRPFVRVAACCRTALQRASTASAPALVLPSSTVLMRREDCRRSVYLGLFCFA